MDEHDVRFIVASGNMDALAMWTAADDRVMFGSDPMNWPTAIGDSIAYLESLDFLTAEEKRMVLYENALRFFDLEDKN